MPADTRRVAAALALLVAVASGCCSARYDQLPERSKEDFPSIYPEARLALDPEMEVRYVAAGQGFPVVFLHGIGADHHQWNLNLPHFAAEHRVLALDFPGHGKSSRPADYPYSIERSADAVVALLDREGIERAVLVGNSMGGLIAMHVAIHRPERVERLVLVDPAGAAFGWGDRFLAESVLGLSRIAPLSVLSECMLRFGVDFVLEDARDHPIVEAYLRKILLAQRDEVESEAYQEMLAATLESILESDVSERAAAIDVPTLIVWGEEDWILDVDYAHDLHRAIRRSALAIFPETGHVPPLERPDRFHLVVDDFLSDLSPR